MNFPGNYLPAIIALCKRHKVKKLFAFGSVLTNRFNEQSDIDLVVDFDKTNVDDYFSNFFFHSLYFANTFRPPLLYQL